MITRVAAALPAVGLKRPATAVKSVESRWIFAKGVATPANRSSASVSVPNASSTTANVAVTAETILARVNNTADSARRRRVTVNAVQRANSLSVAAAKPASNLSPAVYVVQSVTSHSVYVVRTAENRIVELVVQGVYRGRPPVTVAKGVKRQKLASTVLPRSKYWQRPLSLRHPPLCPA